MIIYIGTGVRDINFILKTYFENKMFKSLMKIGSLAYV